MILNINKKLRKVEKLWVKLSDITNFVPDAMPTNFDRTKQSIT